MTHNQRLLADRLAECPGQACTNLCPYDDRHATVHVLACRAEEARAWLQEASFHITEEGRSKRTKTPGRYFVVDWQITDEERSKRVLWPFNGEEA